MTKPTLAENIPSLSPPFAASPDDLALRRAIASRCAKQHLAARPELIGAMLVGSSARGEPHPESDVDVLLFNANAPSDDWEVGHWHERHDGYEVEFTEIAAVAAFDLERTLRDAYWVGGMFDGLILLDPRGLLAQAQRQVRERYLHPDCLRQRLGPVLDIVRRNRQELHLAVASGDPAEFCRAFSFALWTICDALLVRAGRSPSRNHGLERLASIVPHEHAAILRLEGSTDMPLAVTTAHLDWLASRGVIGAGALADLHGMAARGGHREALHVAFTCLGLLVKDATLSGDPAKLASARATAGAWLARLGWRADALAPKARDLDPFVDHVCRLCLDVPPQREIGGSR